MSVDELGEGIRKLPHFKELTDEEIHMILDVLDADRSGTIEFQEFEAFVVGASKPEGKTANSEKRKVVIERLRTVFLGAEKRGLTLEKAFAHLDKDGNGQVSKAELEVSMKELPHFKVTGYYKDLILT